MRINNPLKPKQSRFREYANDSILLCCIILVLIMFLALASYSHLDNGPFHSSGMGTTQNLIGIAGAWFSGLVLTLIGYPGFLIPLLLAYAVWAFASRAFYTGHWPSSATLAIRIFGSLALIASSCALTSLYWLANWMGLLGGTGGWLGDLLASGLHPLLGDAGTSLVLIALLLVGASCATGVSWVMVLDFLGRHTLDTLVLMGRGLRWLWQQSLVTLTRLRDLRSSKKQQTARMRNATMRASAVPAGPEAQPVPNQAPPKLSTSASAEKSESKPNPKPEKAPAPQKHTSPEAPAAPVEEPLPTMDLLQEVLSDGLEGFTADELEDIARALEAHLQNFNVNDCKVVGAQSGPVVTRFELELPPGVKASRVTSIARDLARSLAVTSVRVQENIPGKSCIGVEIPNRNRKVVRLRQLLNTEVFAQQNSPLTLALGEDISGQPVVADLATMPHLLVAGTTGSGKSVAVNSMLLSLLYKSSPEDVRLILVDPKMLELSLYEDIPHLLTPVITDMGEAINAMRWCVMEMERRYQVIAVVGERNLMGYNSRVLQAQASGEPLEYKDKPLEPMARMVVVIDEFADMMMALQGGSKKVETLIARLAQKARAAGIHLLLATQRPSADVITGLIKSNIPARLAFQVSSSVDSRVILDQNGADQLLGYGDALFLPPGSSTPLRVHSAYVDNDEVKKVTSFWTKKGEPQYIEGITRGNPSASDVPGLTIESGADEESDEVYDEAVAFVIQSRKASISSVQRRFKVGYNRAARLVERMEAEGIVSSPGAMGGREVMVSKKPE